MIMENKKHGFKAWLLATRPWSFPASAMPVVATIAYLNWAGYSINWLHSGDYFHDRRRVQEPRKG